jgi:hypothetical protein
VRREGRDQAGEGQQRLLAGGQHAGERLGRVGLQQVQELVQPRECRS